MHNYKVIASLTYGKKLSMGLFVLICISLFLCISLIPLAIACAVLSAEYEILVCLFLPLIGIPSFLYIIIVFSRENKDIRSWERDAVLLPAHAIEIDRIENRMTHIIKLKISVKFIYNGVKMIQKSGEMNHKKGNIFYINTGYDAIYLKCIGHPIHILYSPAYNQVLLLKNWNGNKVNVD